MKTRSYLSQLFPYFVALPLALTLLVVGGCFFFYSQINGRFLLKQDSYVKWEKATDDKKAFALNADKVQQGMDYFKQMSSNESASVQDYLAQHSDEAKGVRIQSVASSALNGTVRDYDASFAISILGHTGDVLSLLVNLQNRYPNAEISQLQISPENTSGLVQISAILSLIKLQ